MPQTAYFEDEKGDLMVKVKSSSLDRKLASLAILRRLQKAFPNQIFSKSENENESEVKNVGK
jgi:hypothetical protein